MVTSQDHASANLPGSYDHYRTLVLAHLHQTLAPYMGEVYELDAYHLGWRDEAGNPIDEAGGKMLRPVLALATCRGYGDPTAAVGVAAALELLHVFSLVHDDIEDGDRERRHRPTLWVLVGNAIAINAGDSLCALAFRALFEAIPALDREAGLLALTIFSDASLRMIEGQHLDISFESRPSVTLDEYVDMTRRKTGALIGAALALGALCGGATADETEQLRQAGVDLGVGFQAVDDILAVWGDPSATGKAVGNDIARGKKSLPTVLVAEQQPDYRLLEPGNLAALRSQLEQLGIDAACQRLATDYCDRARRAIESTSISAAGRRQLLDLVDFVLARRA